MDDLPFAALGLGDLEARILAYVVSEEEVVAADLAAATGVRLSAVSVAVQGLLRRGLLQRIYGRRPSVIFLHPQAPEALARLAEVQAQVQETQRALAAEATAAVVAAAERRVERGRPYHELEPRLRIDSTLAGWPVRRGRLSHAQVMAAPYLGGSAPVSLPGCPARLLISGQLAQTAGLSSGQGMDVARWQQPGSEVKVIELALPLLWLLDGERVGTVAGTKQGVRLVWSQDRLHVRAAQELFELWWARAPAGVVTPDRPALRQWSEADLEVDEWDPEEVGEDGEVSG